MYLTFTSSIIISYVIALIAIAFYTLLERKLLGYYQLRKGPNKVILIGLPQPFADAIKLFTKEQTKPKIINKIPFILAPALALALTLLLWTIYPHHFPSIILPFGVLYFLCVSSLNVYSTFIAGWCSNSKYALLGSLRRIAQTISYEVSISLILLTCLIVHHSININLININIISWVILLLAPTIFLWFITNLAETNRTPFDLAEGESELVSGFNTEYSSATFALIFIAEYANILIIRLLTSTFFIGNFQPINRIFLVVITIVTASIFVWVRASFPRIRYDKLIYLTWKCFLPLTLATLLIIPPISFITTWYCAGWTDNSDDVKYGSSPNI